MRRKCGGKGGKYYDNDVGDNCMPYSFGGKVGGREGVDKNKKKAFFVGIMPFVLLYYQLEIALAHIRLWNQNSANTSCSAYCFFFSPHCLTHIHTYTHFILQPQNDTITCSMSVSHTKTNTDTHTSYIYVHMISRQWQTYSHAMQPILLVAKRIIS